MDIFKKKNIMRKGGIVFGKKRDRNGRRSTGKRSAGRKKRNKAVETQPALAVCFFLVHHFIL